MSNLDLSYSDLSAQMVRHIPEGSRLHTHDRTHCAAVFLDRDGVLVEDVHYLRSTAQLRILPGVGSALRMLSDHFWLIVVTNQSGIARGYLNEDDLAAIHTEMVTQLSAEGATVDAIYSCPHLPDGSVSAYQTTCACRKPAPGMLLCACHDWTIKTEASYMVGDTPRDIEAGLAAGVQSILIGANESLKEPGRFHLWASDLFSAAQLICRREGLNL